MSISEKFKKLIGAGKSERVLCFPCVARLFEVLKTDHRHIYDEVKDMASSEQMKAIFCAAGLDMDIADAGIEEEAYMALIHIQYGDVFEQIRNQYPEAYKTAWEEQGGKVAPLKFAGKLLEGFGIQDCIYPESFDRLRAHLSRDPKAASMNPPFI